MPSATRRRCYRQQPAPEEQARRIVDSLRLHPERTPRDYGVQGALAMLVEQMWQKEDNRAQ